MIFYYVTATFTLDFLHKLIFYFFSHFSLNFFYIMIMYTSIVSADTDSFEIHEILGRNEDSHTERN